jgi:hypothetical protein
MVADSLIYHPTLLKLIKYLDSTAGREKSFRLIQYLVRFLAFYAGTKGLGQLSQLFKSLQGQAAFVRKALRFLKPLNHLRDASKAYDNKLTDSVIRSTVVLKNLAYVGYLSLDTVAWFKLLGLVSTKKFASAPNYANWCWAVGLVAGLVNDLRRVNIADAKLASVADEKEADQAVLVEKASANKRIVWDSLDFFIALNNLKFLNYGEGAVGLAGTFTSIFGVQDVWNATKV